MAQTKSTCYSDRGPDQAAHNRLQLQLWGIDLALVGIHTRVGIHFHTTNKEGGNRGPER